MGQNTSNSVWKPCEDLQKTFDLCHCQQRVYNKVLRWNFVIDQILIFHHNLQINSLKILQCDFLDFFFLFCLIVEVYLWWKLQASLIFLSGRTCTIGGWLNTFLPHCMCQFLQLDYFSFKCAKLWLQSGGAPVTFTWTRRLHPWQPRSSFFLLCWWSWLPWSLLLHWSWKTSKGRSCGHFGSTADHLTGTCPALGSHDRK